MAKIKRRGPSLEDKFLGNEPNWHGTEIPDNKLNLEYSNGSNWFNYFHNPKSNAPIIIQFAQDVLNFSKDDIKALKKLPDWKVSSGVGNACRMHNAGFPLNRMGKPDEEDKAQLEKSIQIALQSGAIKLSDAIDIREIQNIKLANTYLKFRQTENQEAERAAQMQNIQAQTQANSESAEKAAEFISVCNDIGTGIFKSSNDGFGLGLGPEYAAGLGANKE